MEVEKANVVVEPGFLLKRIVDARLGILADVLDGGRQLLPYFGDGVDVPRATDKTNSRVKGLDDEAAADDEVEPEINFAKALVEHPQQPQGIYQRFLRHGLPPSIPILHESHRYWIGYRTTGGGYLAEIGFFWTLSRVSARG